MSFLRGIVRTFVPPPTQKTTQHKEQEPRQNERTITYISKSTQEQIRQGNKIQEDIPNRQEDFLEKETDRQIEDSLLDDLELDDSFEDVKLSKFGEEVQEALNKFGWIDKKRHLDAQIFIEDLGKSVEKIELYYFRYDNRNITPADFYRATQKETSEINLNLRFGILNVDALSVIFVSDGVGVVKLQRI